MTIPANTPAFAVDAYVGGLGLREDAGAGEALGLDRLEGDGVAPVAGTFDEVETSPSHVRLVFRPLEVLEEGYVHELHWGGCPFGGPVRQRYSIGPALLLPAGPATLAAHTDAVARDGRLERFEWVVELSVASGDLGAWGDALDYTLLEPLGGYPDAPEGSTVAFRVPLACEDYPGDISAGDHETHAAIRDLGLALLVEAEATLTASCADPVFVEEGTGRLLTDEEIADLRRVVWDAGVRTDAGLDAGLGDAGGSFDTGPGEPANGNCAAHPRRSSTSTPAVAVLALLVVAWRGLSSRRADRRSTRRSPRPCR